MGRCADENGLAKAFSQLQIASYQDLINHEAYMYIVAVISHLGVEILNHHM